MAGSKDCAPGKQSPVKKKTFANVTKGFHEKWPFVTVDVKGDTCVDSEILL